MSDKPRESEWPMIPMEEAFKLIAAKVHKRPVVSIKTQDALGYVVSEDIRSPENFPPFRASTMDGYAVRCADGPGIYPVLKAITPGDTASIKVSSRTIAQISTGARVPDGADAVIMLEKSRLVKAARDGENELVHLNYHAKEGENIREIGSDISQNQIILQAGDVIGSSEIGLLASLGIREVKTYSKPKVAVLSTGDELVAFETNEPTGSQIRDSNRPSIIALIQDFGFESLDLGIVNDNMDNIKKLILQGLECDLLVTTGGASMGELDLLKPALEQLGAIIHFGRVHMKPGKPTTFATVGDGDKCKLVFSLPGNPVSALVGLHLFVLPALRGMAGYAKTEPAVVPVQISNDITLDSRPEYQRAIIKPKHSGSLVPKPIRGADAAANSVFIAEVTGGQLSSRLMSMRTANALLVLPPKSETQEVIKAGSIVDAVVIGPLTY